MKKLLLPLVAFGTSACVHAQSSLTIGGTVDDALNRATGSVASRTQLVSGSNATSKIILRGTEDLGGGNYAGFYMEAGLNTDSGTGSPTNTNNQPSGAGAANSGMNFNRRSSLHLGGSWGEVQAGRLWSPTYDTFTSRYDLFGVGVGVGLNYIASLDVNQVRVSNAVGYTTPRAWGGLWANVQHWRGENPGGTPTADDGTGSGILVGYESGPWSARAHYAKTEFAAGDASFRALAAYYDSGVWKLAGNMNRDHQGPLRQAGFNVGLLYRFGASEVKTTYSGLNSNPGLAAQVSRKVALGYVYNLSKRTAVYSTIARIGNRNGAALAIAGATTAVNGASRGLDLGIRHNF